MLLPNCMWWECMGLVWRAFALVHGVGFCGVLVAGSPTIFLPCHSGPVSTGSAKWCKTVLRTASYFHRCPGSCGVTRRKVSGTSLFRAPPGGVREGPEGLFTLVTCTSQPLGTLLWKRTASPRSNIFRTPLAAITDTFVFVETGPNLRRLGTVGQVRTGPAVLPYRCTSGQTRAQGYGFCAKRRSPSQNLSVLVRVQ
jgi:hypothetical protein